MKKEDGSDYKEYSLKCMWNSTAKTLQEIYYLKKFNRKIDPFQGVEFKSARDARNAKRRELQKFSEKRKRSSTALSLKHIHDIIDKLDEQTPDGLQKIFYYLASVELAWRDGEDATCWTEYFKFETSEEGKKTGRLEYNPIFTKICQVVDFKCSKSAILPS
ncbi:unnamed protein product [Psylliodes chrysocephalus]|uniref:Uncharacterized protein n=1 Tax=Psylliodes chrysocephalus TaxID=3402493 RepID=A0A9P0D6X2_9CUCU|nr:unnamed protein product [Psylliodes chrysocephala]